MDCSVADSIESTLPPTIRTKSTDAFSGVPTPALFVCFRTSARKQVLNAQGVSSASDVYSFGIVAWEVISMEIPWADEALPFDIFTRVVFKGDRPEIPADAPVDIAGVLRACWATAPEERPASAEILNILKIRALIP